MTKEEARERAITTVHEWANGHRSFEEMKAAIDAYAAAERLRSDGELLALYRWWSEEMYCAGFLHPSPETVTAFLDHLDSMRLASLTDYESEFLREARKQLAERERV